MWERAGVHVSVHIRVRALVYPHACVPAHLWARALACPHAHACLCIGAVACMHARVCAHKARPCQISLPVTPRTRVCHSTRPAVAGDVFALTCPCPVPTVAVLPTLPGGLWVSPCRARLHPRRGPRKCLIGAGRLPSPCPWPRVQAGVQASASPCPPAAPAHAEVPRLRPDAPPVPRGAGTRGAKR